MTTPIPVTPENKALAAAVNARMAADSRIVNSKAAMFRALGIGGAIALVGIGIGAAFFGFSYVTDSKSATEKMANAFAAALERTTIKTQGEIKLDPDAKVGFGGGTVSLDPNTTVKIDPDSTVKLDRNAKVGVSGDLARPSSEQLRPDMGSKSGGATVTNYTVFKNVKFGPGTVVTGWTFTSSEQPRPDHQYCYFAQDVGEDSSTMVKVDLAKNGVMLPNVKARNFDVAAAASSCIWFEGSSTRI
ncbi:hypothetical protein FG93_01015 [Bosea sp. LC85]|uniref:hypothetical protein n=1 Tax=Bosea sp. LC85 TaxID=1502851 RepID=UPI0004E33FA4|nr:hypothetical protein [Bosea sp. LC85]KFC74836.1 hypothetical protein FG93_01015 [Bosea sp. LC85]